MKKIYILVFLSALCGWSANAQVAYIPDSIFKAYLLADTLINTNKDTSISVAEAAEYTGAINVSNLGIKDLTGIQAFTALTGLDCSYNKLTSLDVSSNTILQELNCEGNYYLTSLNVSSDTALSSLSCQFNSLTSLDLSSNKALFNLVCSWNFLTSLDVSSNTALFFLICGFNSLTNLNLSSNTSLYLLQCDSDGLTSLDVSHNTALSYLSCYKNALTNLDLSSNTNLYALFCYNNSLTSLNVKNGNNQNIDSTYFDATNNPMLTCIKVDSVAYSTANWTSIDPWAHFNTNCTPGACSAYFTINADTTQLHHYIITNMASGVGPINYYWRWGDGTYDTIPYPSHTYTDSGFYTICLTITDSSGCISTYCDSSFHIMRTTNYMVYINVVPPLLTGIDVSTQAASISIYPNPVKEKFTIYNLRFTIASMNIYNVLGQVCAQSEIVNRTSEIVVDVSSLPSGIYFMQILGEKERWVGKFVKE